MMKLIITSDGGNGHNAAADKLKTEFVNEGSATINIVTDGWLTLEALAKKYWVGNLPLISRLFSYNIGKEGAKQWNEAQKNNDATTLNHLIRLQPVAQALFYDNVHKQMLEALHHYPNVDMVISTQPNCLAAIHVAIYEFNVKYKKKIILKLVMTDIPTVDAIHFLSAVKLLNPEDFAFAPFDFEVPFPEVLYDHPSLADYHVALAKQYPKLYEADEALPKNNVNITFTSGPISRVFEEIQEELLSYSPNAIKKKYKNIPIAIQFTDKAYQLLTTEVTEIKKEWQHIQGGQVKFHVPKHAHITTVMLGSQAAKKASVDVLQKELQVYDLVNLTENHPHYIFIFCGDDIADDSLFYAATQFAKTHNKVNQFMIMPLTKQNHQMISHLYCIADHIILRPGGMSIMEVAAVATGNITILAELNGKLSDSQARKDPTLTLMAWERGNSFYLQHKLGKHRVQIANTLTYLDMMKKRLVTCKPTNFSIMPVLQKKYDELRDTCYSLYDINDKNIHLHLIGWSVYHLLYSPNTLQSTKMYQFGIFYAMGSEQYQQFFLDRTLHHPNAFAIRFSQYFMQCIEKKEIAINDLNIFIDQHLTYVKYYVRAFYEEKIKILSHSMAHQYAIYYQQALKEGYPMGAARLKACAAAGEHQTMYFRLPKEECNCKNCETIWHQASHLSLPLRVKAIFASYSPSGLLQRFATWRSQSARADEIIKKMDMLVAANKITATDVLDYLNRYSIACQDEINQKGTFNRQLHFVLYKLQSMLVEPEMNREMVLKHYY